MILTADGSCPNGDYEVVFNGEKAFSIWCASSWIVNWLRSFQRTPRAILSWRKMIVVNCLRSVGRQAKCAWLFFSWQVVRPGFDLATAISCGDVEGAGRPGCADSMCPKHIVWEAFEVQGLG